jgi:hypothetical protein
MTTNKILALACIAAALAGCSSYEPPLTAQDMQEMLAECKALEPAESAYCYSSIRDAADVARIQQTLAAQERQEALSRMGEGE